MTIKTLTAGPVLALLAAACMSAPVNRDIAFAEPPGFAQCPAENAVDWEGSLSWVDLDDVARRQSEGGRVYDDLTGDDVAVHFYAGANIHVGRVNYGRAVRRNGIWTYETAQSPNSLVPPPPPPPPPPPGAPAIEPQDYACTGLHYKARGVPGAELEAALEAFLDDGCRAYIPPYTPAPLFMRNENGRDCSDGAAYSIRVETAEGVEHYDRGCAIPGSTLTDLMRAFERAPSPQDAVRYSADTRAFVTLMPEPSHDRIAMQCRRLLLETGTEIDLDDPFQW